MHDDHFAMDAHISNICRSTYFHIRNIGAIRDLLTPSAAALLVHSLVTSRVDLLQCTASWGTRLQNQTPTENA